MTVSKPPKWHKIAILCGGLAVAAAVARYVLQGTGGVYTQLSRRFYENDPTLGWTLTESSYVWLGLEVIAVMAVVVLAAIVANRWWARRGDRAWTWLRWGAHVDAALCVTLLAVPLVAFTSGSPPEGAQALLPTSADAASEQTSPVADGTYRVLTSEHSTVVATIEAGQEKFQGRFSPPTGEVTVTRGTWRGAIAVPSASIATGIDLRDEHARGYLKDTEHTTITVAFDGKRADGVIDGTIKIAGRTVARPLAVTVTPVTGDAVERLPAGARYLVTASLTISVTEAGLEREAFDSDVVAVVAKLVVGD